jgi:branched-chain amino acid transport system permease protein
MEAQEISTVHFSVRPLFRLLPFALLLLVPLFAGRFYQYLTTQIMVAALMAISFNLLLGTTGLLSFGQAAFFGVGAYTVALLCTKGGFGPVPALLLSPFFAGAVAASSGSSASACRASTSRC